MTQKPQQSPANPLYETEGRITYLDQKSLAKKAGMSTRKKAFLVVMAAIALALGLFVFFKIVPLFTHTTSFSQAPVEEALQEQAYDFPQAEQIALLSADDIVSYLDSNHISYYNATSSEQKSLGGLDVIKLPDGVDLLTAGALYSQGIDKLNASEAVTLLNGSWQLTLRVQGGYELRIRYASFASTTDQEAVEMARTEFGLGNATVTAQGVDQHGNTYFIGEIQSAEGPLTWRIGACPLSEMYAIDGLPSTASYVVVRIFHS